MDVADMRIDLPQCNLKTCRYCFDHNCTNKIEYDRCEYQLLRSYIYFTDNEVALKEHSADAKRITEAVEKTQKYLRK
jgi:hypothetical protein